MLQAISICAETTHRPLHVTVYLHVQGTLKSKKKKKNKLDRVMATLKRKARQGKAQEQHSFAALQLIHDPQVLWCLNFCTAGQMLI